MRGAKAIADGGQPLIDGNGEVMDEDLEDGEVDEDGDVNLASNGDAGGRASKSGIIGPQLPPTKSVATDTEDQEKAKATKTLPSERDTLAETAEATGSGMTTAPLSIQDSDCVLYSLLRPSLTICVGQDQILENIKMAYWWAGYYSGLYEGQQQVTGASTR
jgi:hypothetical protein